MDNRQMLTSTVGLDMDDKYMDDDDDDDDDDEDDIALGIHSVSLDDKLSNRDFDMSDSQVCRIIIMILIYICIYIIIYIIVYIPIYVYTYINLLVRDKYI